uniref:Uncharacterized protein n=1 Tax=Sphaerodactylus townsendi TaxID=933632 RepID=A0ACB8FK08_9SAUR
MTCATEDSAFPADPNSPRPFSFREGQKDHLEFLSAVRTTCQGGRRSLPFPKEAVGEAIKDIMVDSLLAVGPTLLLAVAAVCGSLGVKFHLAFSAPLCRSLETRGLRLVLSRSSGPAAEASQAPGDMAEGGLLNMLGGLLQEDPFAGPLASILDQLVYWAQVDWEAPRYRSLNVILDLLGVMRELPSFNILEEDVLGSLGVQLAVSVRGKRRCPVWAHDPEWPWRVSCFHLLTMAEVFWVHLSNGQKIAFQEAALQHARLLQGRRWAREVGLILLYASVSQARPLLEEQDEDYLKGDVSGLLYDVQMGRQVPKDIQALAQRTGKASFQGRRGGDGTVASGVPHGPNLLFIHTKAIVWIPDWSRVGRGLPFSETGRFLGRSAESDTFQFLLRCHDQGGPLLHQPPVPGSRALELRRCLFPRAEMGLQG